MGKSEGDGAESGRKRRTSKLRKIKAVANGNEQAEQTSGKKDIIEAAPSDNSRSGGPPTARDPDQCAYSG